MRRALLATVVVSILTPCYPASAQLASGYQPQSDSYGARDQQMPQDMRDRATRDLVVDKQEQEARQRAHAKPRGPQPANAADIIPGREVRDPKGLVIGSVETVDTDGAVIVAQSGRVKVPLDAFGKDAKGLVFGVSKGEFEKLVVSANASPAQ